MQVATQLKDTKFAREGMLLQKYVQHSTHEDFGERLLLCFKRQSCRFFKTMNDDELRAWYGEEHVLLAAERGAIGTLLISDRLFR